MLQPIDAVITWVDGNDPLIVEKHLKYLGEKKKGDPSFSTRFASNDEIFYCISSILKNAPFFKNIYVVTDGQTPKALNKIGKVFGKEALSKIKIVDHASIFQGYDQFLPTFNSISIETMIHRIPNLSERYVYFNDDFIISSPINESDFFKGTMPILRGKWRKVSEVTLAVSQRQRMQEGRLHFGGKLFSYKECQLNASNLLGFKYNHRFFWHDHTPHPFNRQVMEDFFKLNESVLLENIKFKFRDPSQIDPMSISNVLELSAGNENIKETELTLLKPSSKLFQINYVYRKRRSSKKQKSLFLCFQSLDCCRSSTRDAVYDWLDDILFYDCLKAVDV